MSEADAVEVVPLTYSARASVTVAIVCLARSLSVSPYIVLEERIPLTEICRRVALAHRSHILPAFAVQSIEPCRDKHIVLLVNYGLAVLNGGVRRRFGSAVGDELHVGTRCPVVAAAIGLHTSALIAEAVHRRRSRSSVCPYSR